MQPKTLIWIGGVGGSVIGGYMPLLWGGSAFSFTSIFLSALGAIGGIWLAFRISQTYF
jgi:hypothetical protein